MFRYKTTLFFSICIIFLAALTLGLPFVHLHPRLTHADDFDEHSHAGVIHTIFSSANAINPSSSSDGHDSGNPAERSLITINQNLFARRLPIETNSNPLTAVLASSDFLRSPITIYTALIRRNVLSPRLSWVGSLPSLRAPPNHSLY